MYDEMKFPNQHFFVGITSHLNDSVISFNGNYDNIVVLLCRIRVLESISFLSKWRISKVDSYNQIVILMISLRILYELHTTFK